ncbi:hypothetical protein MCOR32_009770 [Pyricularia oryzae]|nr:hypothetical protein MCOR32_009770 [Pyricularia oryzae]
MFHIRFSSLAPCSVLCPLLAISQKSSFQIHLAGPRNLPVDQRIERRPKVPSAKRPTQTVDKNGSVSARLPFAATWLPRRVGPGQQQRRRIATATSSRSLAFAWMVHCEKPPQGALVPWCSGLMGARGRLWQRSPGARGWGLYPGPHRQFDTMEMKAMERGPKKDDFDCAHDEQPASGLQAEW